ncbi:hypothetical protein G7Y79_00047g083080 [Physcia stellaris]|nr:hypothetical protein G7Y79_00047g083080 [Physcia stellaris]
MKYHLHSHLLIILLLLYTSRAYVLDFGSREVHKRAQAPANNTFPFRNVYLIIDVDPTKYAISTATGRKVYGGHMQLRIDGTRTDGPLIIQVGYPPVGIPRSAPFFEVIAKDLGIANTGKPISKEARGGAIRDIFRVGRTALPNAWLFDHQKGTGLIADAWNDDPVYAIGTGSKPNSCIELLERVLQRLQLRVDPVVERLIDNMREYYTFYSERIVGRIQLVVSTQVSPADSVIRAMERLDIRVFNVDFVQNPRAPILVLQDVVFRPEGRAIFEECCPVA